MANFTNSRKVRLWVLLLVLSWLTPSFVVLKNNLSSGTNYHHTTKRYVDDTLTVMKDEGSAYSFLHVLNDLHPSISFTMELATENTLPFLGMVLRKDRQNIATSVYVKPTNTGLLLHYDSHVDNRCKKSLIITMLDRAFKLSSNWSLFHEECIRLKTLFLQLAYPEHLIHSMISNFITSKQTPAPPRDSTPDQYELFYHSRNKNQLTLCANCERILVTC